jgi:hypothetical protein
MDRSPRLAELVVHLTGCNPRVAMAAVETATDVEPASVDDALTIVARAMCSIRRVDLRPVTRPVDLRDSAQVTSL